MRKIFTLALLAATALPAMANAQSAQELRHDRQDIHQEQRDLNQARRHGDRDDIRDERRDVQEARREYRDDWRDYRKSHRQVYARGNWKAPFRYRWYNAGAQLRPEYYAPRYYIGDYGRYRLAAPRENLRWIRHYNDVLLVNIRTGRVIQVERDFFW
jgi:Ni/Co efflux regulator RcnB